MATASPTSTRAYGQAVPADDADRIEGIKKQREIVLAEQDSLAKMMERVQFDAAKEKEELARKFAKAKAQADKLEAEWKALASNPSTLAPVANPARQLEAANVRIKQLEVELSRMKTLVAKFSTDGDKPRGAMSGPEPVASNPKPKTGTDLRTAPGMGGAMAGGFGGGGMGGSFGGGGMGGGGMGGGAAGTRPTSQVLNLGSGTANVLVIPPGMDRVTILNTETNARETYRAPQGVTQVTPLFGANGGALMLKGPEIGQVVAFDAKEGRWYPQDLREPAKDQAIPLVSGESVTYPRGKFIYTFSFEARKWSVLELKADGPRAGTFPGGGGKTIVPDGDQIHIYNAKTGEWTHLDTKDEK